MSNQQHEPLRPTSIEEPDELNNDDVDPSQRILTIPVHVPSASASTSATKSRDNKNKTAKLIVPSDALPAQSQSPQLYPYERRRAFASAETLSAIPRSTTFLLSSRIALSAASIGSQAGFHVARTGTKFGFGFLKTILNAGATVGEGLLDVATGGGGGNGANREGEKGWFRNAVDYGVGAAEWMTLFGIELGSAITSGSFVVANESLNIATELYGNDEALISLSAFVTLVRREWSTSLPSDPPGGLAQFTVFEITRALAAWIALDSVTQSVYGRRVAPHITLVPLDLTGDREGNVVGGARRKRGVGGKTWLEKEEEEEALFDLDLEVKEEEITADGEEVITGEITRRDSDGVEQRPPVDRIHSNGQMPGLKEEEDHLNREHLRRYSRLALGSYGGVGYLIFGGAAPTMASAAASAANESRRESRRAARRARHRTRHTSEDGRSDSLLTEENLSRLQREREDDEDALREAVEGLGRPLRHEKREPSASSGLGFPASPKSAEGRTLSPGASASASGTATSGVGRAASRAERRERKVERREERREKKAERRDERRERRNARKDSKRSASGATSPLAQGEEGSETPSVYVTASPGPGLASRQEGAETSEDEDDEDEDEDEDSVGEASMPGSLGLNREYTTWDLLMGTHDAELIEEAGALEPGSVRLGSMDIDDAASSGAGTAKPDDDAAGGAAGPSSAPRRTTEPENVEIPKDKRKTRHPPRFFVITDHPTSSVLLCLRGTLSFDDVMTDLTCESEVFDPELYWEPETIARGRQAAGGKGKAPEALATEDPDDKPYKVHGGMYDIARAMADPGAPVTKAIAKALRKNPTYDLYLAGHSLGAGVASLIGLMWADPDTCLTSTRSGLPAGVKIKVYGFAPPCTTSANLSERCKRLVHSFAYSHDLVARLGLGQILDLRSVGAWLCYMNRNHPSDSCTQIIKRVVDYRRGKFDNDPPEKLDELNWFVSLREALERNMVSNELYPPGDVYWLTKGTDLELPGEEGTVRPDYRLYRVTGDISKVFGQIVFAGNMLAGHSPHLYMRLIESWLKG